MYQKRTYGYYCNKLPKKKEHIVTLESSVHDNLHRIIPVFNFMYRYIYLIFTVHTKYELMLRFKAACIELVW